MRSSFAAALLCVSTIAAAADRYEGSWFSCEVAMGGRQNPWNVSRISRDGNKITVSSEWGARYSFSGTATRVGKALVVRGCAYEGDEPMDGCDPANPPVARKLGLPLKRERPANLDAALKRGEAIAVRSPRDLDRLIKRCERLVENKAVKKRSR